MIFFLSIGRYPDHVAKLNHSAFYDEIWREQYTISTTVDPTVDMARIRGDKRDLTILGIVMSGWQDLKCHGFGLLPQRYLDMEPGSQNARLVKRAYWLINLLFGEREKIPRVQVKTLVFFWNGALSKV